MSLLSLFALLLPLTIAVDITRDPSLDAQLKSDATSLDRLASLPDNAQWTFDFSAQKTYSWAPGSVVNANAATFPALTTLGMTLATLNLGPCAMLPPHWHPRATNLVVAVLGNTTTWMIAENGARPVVTKLTPGVMTVFPTGSLHAMQNNGCDNAQLISALNSEDSGTNTVMNLAFGNLPADMLLAAFGREDLNIEDLGSKIPEVGAGSALGSAECLKRCGMDDGRGQVEKVKRVVQW